MKARARSISGIRGDYSICVCAFVCSCVCVCVCVCVVAYVFNMTEVDLFVCMFRQTPQSVRSIGLSREQLSSGYLIFPYPFAVFGNIASALIDTKNRFILLT